MVPSPLSSSHVTTYTPHKQTLSNKHKYTFLSVNHLSRPPMRPAGRRPSSSWYTETWSPWMVVWCSPKASQATKRMQPPELESLFMARATASATNASACARVKSSLSPKNKARVRLVLRGDDKQGLNAPMRTVLQRRRGSSQI